MLDGVSLSDLEKRMMYFTESDDATEDAAQLNDEFEAEYETAAYEAKVSKLLHHAYARLKRRIQNQLACGTSLSAFCEKVTITFLFYGTKCQNVLLTIP